MSQRYYQNALAFLNQSRFDLAEGELKKYLQSNVDDGMAYSFLAYTQLMQDKKDGVYDLAQKGLQYCPDEPFSHYVLSLAYMDVKKDPKKAEKFILQALKLDYQNPSFYNLHSMIKGSQGKWKEALEIADQGLKIDPESIGCKNAKATALRQLNRPEEADEVLTGTLRHDPNNPITLANKGWQAIDRGKIDDALNLFRESLRIDPTNDWAKSGLVTAMKGKYFFFRIFLAYYNWAGKLDKRVQWGFLIGAYVIVRILRMIARSNPEFSPFVLPIVAAYGVFAFFTWSINPIFNFFMRFNKYGRHALSKGETMGANVIAILVGLTALQVLLTFLTQNGNFITGAIGTFILIMPYSAAFNAYEHRRFELFLGISVGLSIILIFSVAASSFGMNDIGGPAYGIFIAGILITLIAANIMLTSK